MRRRWPICALILWLAAPAAAGRGREVSVALLWQSADGCLDTAALHGAVRSRRQPVGSAAEADAIISGRARRGAAGGWQVELVVADRGGAILGRRSLAVAHGGCAALREHVALVVAMLIDSSVVERAAPPAPPPSPEAEPARWRGDAALSLAGEAGRLPGAVPGLAAAAGIASPGGWRAELAILAFASASASDASGATSLRWLAAAASACPPGLRPPAWHITGCAGVEVGGVIAEGSGFTRNQRDRQLLADLVGRLRVERELVGPLFAAAGLALRVALLRPRFGYEDETGQFQPLYEPRAVAAGADLGLGVHFP